VGVTDWLTQLAESALDDGEGVNWPTHEGTSPTMAFWCHGAAGIARFLTRVHATLNVPTAIGLAKSAARTVSQGTRWAGSSQCHGLSGSIECLLDLYLSTGEQEYLDDAREIASLLTAFVTRSGGSSGFVVEGDESVLGFTHGYAGVASSLLRLAHPSERPHVLTAEGFGASAKPIQERR
jgi:lantibiotic modifying enzyme